MPTYCCFATEAELAAFPQVSERAAMSQPIAVTVDKLGRRHVSVVVHARRYKFYPEAPVEVPEVSRGRLVQRLGAFGDIPVREVIVGSAEDEHLYRRYLERRAKEEETTRGFSQAPPASAGSPGNGPAPKPEAPSLEEALAKAAAAVPQVVEKVVEKRVVPVPSRGILVKFSRHELDEYIGLLGIEVPEDAKNAALVDLIDAAR